MEDRYPAECRWREEKAGKLCPGDFCVGVGQGGELDFRIFKKGAPWSGDQGTWNPAWIEECVLEVGRRLKDEKVGP